MSNFHFAENDRRGDPRYAPYGYRARQLVVSSYLRDTKPTQVFGLHIPSPRDSQELSTQAT